MNTISEWDEHYFTKVELLIKQHLINTFYGQSLDYDTLMHSVAKYFTQSHVNTRIVHNIVVEFIRDCTEQNSIFGLETTKGFKEEYFFLSNMFPVEIIYQDQIFNSSEQLYQYLKALSISSELASEVLSSAAPKDSKRIMKGIKVDKETRARAMTIAIDEKFKIGFLRELLLLTKPVNIVEYNRWGDEFCGKAIPKGGTINDAKGKNYLGLMLQEKRSWV